MSEENVSNASTEKTNCCLNCSNGCGKRCLKVFLTALVITVLGTAIGFLTCGWLFNWIYFIEPVAVWKMPTFQTMLVNFIGELVLAMILVCVFVKLYDGISYTGWKKGVIFGFFIWLVSTLPGMFATYLWMNVAVEWIVYATIIGLITLLIKGAVIGAMCKK